MATVMFDTHKFIRRLKEAGMPEPQAEALVEAFGEGQATADLATRRDIKEVEAGLKRDIEALRLATKADMEGMRGELKRDIESVRTEVHRMGMVIVMWNVGTVIATAGIVVAMLRWVGGAP